MSRSKQDDREIYKNFLVTQKTDAERYAHSIMFFRWFVNDDGTPKNPQNKPCQRVQEILRNLRIINRSRAFPNLSEQTQMTMYLDEG